MNYRSDNIHLEAVVGIPIWPAREVSRKDLYELAVRTGHDVQGFPSYEDGGKKESENRVIIFLHHRTFLDGDK